MHASEPARLISWSPEAGDIFSRCSVNHPHFAIDTGAYIQELLRGIRREADPASGADAGEPRRLAFDEDVSLEVPHFVENLHAVTQSIADVNETVVANHDAVHDFQEYTPNSTVCLGDRALSPPLAKEM